jgi:hypothetical protein
MLYFVSVSWRLPQPVSSRKIRKVLLAAHPEALKDRFEVVEG